MGKLNPPYEFSMEVRPPITENGSYTMNCNGFMLSNAGNTLITIDNGLTIQPGQTFDSSGVFYDVIKQTLNFQFGLTNIVNPPAAIINRLEIVEFIKGKETEVCK